MDPFDQEELASMHAAGAAFNDEVEAFRRKGGDPSVVWNNIYDGADVVFAVCRRQRGGCAATLVKGVEPCERIMSTGQGELARIASLVVQGPEAAFGMRRVFDQSPKARWVHAIQLNGQLVLGLN